MTSTRRIRDSAFQGSRTPGQAHAPFPCHATDGVRLKLGDWARREGLVGFRVSPREAWFELARDIVQLFFSVNLLVCEVVTNLGDLLEIINVLLKTSYLVNNEVDLSPFGQVDEATFKKVRISFSDESEILHVNTKVRN